MMLTWGIRLSQLQKEGEAHNTCNTDAKTAIELAKVG